MRSGGWDLSLSSSCLEAGTPVISHVWAGLFPVPVELLHTFLSQANQLSPAPSTSRRPRTATGASCPWAWSARISAPRSVNNHPMAVFKRGHMAMNHLAGLMKEILKSDPVRIKGGSNQREKKGKSDATLGWHTFSFQPPKCLTGGRWSGFEFFRAFESDDV